MVAFGCLSLVLLPLIGLAAGGYLAGQQGGILGASAGLIVAAIICTVSAYALVTASRRR